MLKPEEIQEILNQILSKFEASNAKTPDSFYQMPVYGLGEIDTKPTRPTYEETERALGLAAQLNVRLSEDFMRLASQNRYNTLDAQAVQVFQLGPYDRTDACISDAFFDAEIVANNAREGVLGPDGIITFPQAL